jgi:hypothetical protein
MPEWNGKTMISNQKMEIYKSLLGCCFGTIFSKSQAVQEETLGIIMNGG